MAKPKYDKKSFKMYTGTEWDKYDAFAELQKAYGEGGEDEIEEENFGFADK